MKIACNGKIVDEREAVVSVMDHGFLYGMGCFETFRTYGGRPFLLTAHLERLRRGCDMLGIRATIDEHQVRKLIDALLEANGLEDAYIRYSISAGEAPLGLPAGDYMRPVTIIHVKALPPRDEALYRQGKTLQVLQLRRNTPEGDIRLKSFHFMNNILGKRELARYPWCADRQAEGLFLTEDGHLAEGTVSNVFFVREGICFTPSIDTGILPGITREFMMTLCRRMDITVKEGLFSLADLAAANEIFMTNSIQEIVPIEVVFDPTGRKIWRGEASRPYTERLMSAYRLETIEKR